MLNRRQFADGDDRTMVFYLLRKRLTGKRKDNNDERPDGPDTEKPD